MKMKLIAGKRDERQEAEKLLRARKACRYLTQSIKHMERIVAGGRGAGGSFSSRCGHGTGAGQVPLSDALGCDSSAFDSWGYIIICTRDWTR